MLSKKKVNLFLFVLSLIMILFLSASSIPGLTHYVLDNGLELFVVENHNVPLVTIQIAFRTGAISQDASNCGLFHLYEHMLFKGNSKFKTQSEFMAAMNKLGASTWNGGTSYEYVDYYFTIPSYNLEKGLEFWAYAVKEPLFLEEELIPERDVVASEVQGYLTTPSQIFSAAQNQKMFYKYPWRRDISGSIQIIKSATVQQLRDIQNRFYIPNNAALFVGGDVNPKEVLEYAKKYYGDWKKGQDPWAKPLDPHPSLKADVNLIYPDGTFYTRYGLVRIAYRGPDVLKDTADTYATDVFLFLVSNPNGKFKKNIYAGSPILLDPEYMDVSYPTQRDGGIIYFYAYIDTAVDNIIGEVERLRKVVIDEFTKVANDPNYFSAEELALAKTKLSDNNLFSMETPSDFISTISFWWSTATTEYFFGYEDNCKKVTMTDIQNLIKKYIIGKPAVLGLRLHTNRFNDDVQMQNNLKKYNYEVVTSQNAFWWNNK